MLGRAPPSSGSSCRSDNRPNDLAAWRLQTELGRRRKLSLPQQLTPGTLRMANKLQVQQ
ncbi:MAG TPA: hypothetical protein VFT53_04425 [Candidatus Saccharimonadales bacterium]|nr:hypothetical protein [Candidatus Saccharimonadales bacterium]